MLRRYGRMVLAGAGLIISLSFNRPATTGRVQLRFEHYVGGEKLKLDAGRYTNALGQEFSVSKFKYYISNLCLKGPSGNRFHLDGSFLIDEEDTARKHRVLESIPFGSYESIEFIIGVDSLHNCSGAQSGDLDPVHAMFWAWNTGYIFMKLEGTAPAAKTPGHFFEYHVGGYRAPDNCIRKVTLPLSQLLTVGKEQPAVITLQADVTRLLKTPFVIDFSLLPAVTDRRNATLLADNYSNLFSIAAP
jgi:hypothetical protein